MCILHQIRSTVMEELLLEGIIRRLYEDNLEGHISVELFARLSASYETEKRTLETRFTELKTRLAADQDKPVYTARFLRLVRKYTDFRN